MRTREICKRLFTVKNVFTIPNALSLFRLCLIPLIIRLYRVEQNYYGAAGVIALSGLTDVVDGWIARRFHMVSDIGKLLDPVADKLTQASLLLCLTGRYKWMWALLALFFIKELTQTALGGMTLKKYGEVNSAKWYGKASTVTLYASMVILVLFPNVHASIAVMLGVVCAAMLTIALMLYSRFYFRMLKDNRS